MNTITFIIGSLSIFLAVLLEGVGISSVIIYSKNTYIINDPNITCSFIYNSYTTCSSSILSFLLGYGIANIIFGVVWIIFTILIFLYRPAFFCKRDIYGAFFIGNIMFTVLMILTGFVISIFYYTNFQKVNYEIWSVYLSIVILTPISFVCIVLVCINC